MYKSPMPMQLTDQDVQAAGVLPAFYRGPQGEPGPGADVVKRVSALADSVLAIGTVIETVGIPVYVDAEKLPEYEAWGLTATGWYIFARIKAPDGERVTAETTVTGAAGYILSAPRNCVDVAVRFEVAALCKQVDIRYGGAEDHFVFRATDLATRNLDYRTTFYIYDIAPFATWHYALTTDTTFAKDKQYYTKDGEEYVKAEVQTVQYSLTADETFQTGKKYYIREGDAYTEATVTAGEAVTQDTYYEASDVPVPADTYYVHSKITFEGMTRNVTYQLDEIIDCPQEYILPEIEDDGHGAWFEIRLRHSGSFSSTLIVPEGVKVATEHTRAETAGFNMVDLHYNSIDGVKMWRFMNTHSTIPADGGSDG